MSDRIADELIRCHEGDPWHGPSLRKILGELTAARAVAKPIAAAHSAWEILLHMDAWHHVVLRRLDGEQCKEPPQDFPSPLTISEEAWLSACASFGETLHVMAERIRSVNTDDPKIDSMLSGVVHHLIYHSGQIAILAKS